MSDFIEQNESQIHQQSQEILVDTSKKWENGKDTNLRFKVSRIALILRRYRPSIAINIFIVGIVCLLFFLQKHWMNYGNKDIGHLVEKKVIEIAKKNMSLNNALINIPDENDRFERSILNKKDVDTLASMDRRNEASVDNSKYIIEANRLYEQGYYENAAIYYEEGLNNSMSFLNQDFIMYRLGDCYFLSKRYKDALRVFNTLISDYINSPYQFKSRLKMGECYATIGEFKQALKSLYTILAQEGRCSSEDDKLIVADSYFKIADYYMEEAKRLLKMSTIGTSSTNQ